MSRLLETDPEWSDRCRIPSSDEPGRWFHAVELPLDRPEQAGV